MQTSLNRDIKKQTGTMIMLSFRAAKFTLRALFRQLSKWCHHIRYDGKQSLKNLHSKPGNIERLDNEMLQDCMKPLKKYLKKYGIDYSVMKDKSTIPPTYQVFFKGKDRKVIEQCLKEAVEEWDQKGKRKEKEGVMDKLRRKKKESKEQMKEEKVKDKEICR